MKLFIWWSWIQIRKICFLEVSFWLQYLRYFFVRRYVALEDFENGIKSYHHALRIDGRHYNAWYGLGMIYLRQEKFEFSEHHFRMAFQINPRSSVIMSYLGTAFHALKVSAFLLDSGPRVQKWSFISCDYMNLGLVSSDRKTMKLLRWWRRPFWQIKKNLCPCIRRLIYLWA